MLNKTTIKITIHTLMMGGDDYNDDVFVANSVTLTIIPLYIKQLTNSWTKEKH